MSDVLTLCSDDAFGPAVATQFCRGGFDFTVTFEETILSIGPAIVFLLAIPLRVLHLWRKPTKVRRTCLHVIKLCSTFFLAALQLALLIALALNTTQSARFSVASRALNLSCAFGLGLLSHFEHKKSIRPSLIITLYLLISVVFDIVQARTYWLLDNKHTIPVILITVITAKIIMLVLEDLNKKRYLLSVYRHIASESRSGTFSRTLFWWLNPLLLKGFKTVLSIGDLYTINQALSSAQILEQLQKTWVKRNPKNRFSLLWTVVVSFRWSFISIVIPRLGLVGLKVAQPFLIKDAISFINSRSSEQSSNIGYGLIGAYAFVYIGIAILTAWYQHLTYRLITMVRGGLVAMIYSQMIKLKRVDAEDSSAMTLMGTDVERIAEVFEFVSEIWADTIQIIIAIWMLSTELGVACVMPIAIAIAATLSSMKLGSYVTRRQKTWFEAIQKRINTTSEIISSMRSVKMLGLTDKFLATIQIMRTKELGLSKHFRKLSTTNTCLMNVPIILTPTLTFAIFAISGAKGGGTLNVTRTFTSLSVLNLLSYPIAGVIFAIPQIYSTIGCFQRIQDFLLEEPHKDYRQFLLPPSSDDSPESIGVELLPYPQSHQSTIEGRVNGYGVSIRDGSYGWPKDNTPIIRDINLQIPQSALTVIMGPSGCGKSTLLKAILGETVNLDGSLFVQSAEIAFCDQNTWIKSGTLRANILGQAEYDETWYQSVISACALTKDLQQIAHGDQTDIGSNGTILSGGQKQRLAIARAVYARKQVAIFDDVLSGLDSVTEEAVFNQVFGNDGLLRKNHTTVILVTQNSNHLPLADYVVGFGPNGHILDQGTYENVKSSGNLSHIIKTQRQKNEHDQTKEASDVDMESRTRPVQNVVLTNDASRQLGDIKIYKYYLESMGWWNFGLFCCFISLHAVFSAVQYLWLNWWSAAEDISSKPRLSYWLGLYALFGILQSIAMISGVLHLFLFIVPKSARNLHWTLLKAVMMAPLTVFTEIETGALINRFSQDMRLIDMTLPAALINTSFQFASCIGGAALTVAAVKYTAAALPIIGGILYLVQRFYLRTSRQLRLLEIEAKAPLYSQFIESLAGLVTIRAFGWSEAFLTRNLKLIDESQKPFYLLFCIQRWLGLVLDLLVAGFAILLVALAVNLRDNISAGFLGIALVNIMNLGHSLAALIKFWTSLETSLGAISRVKNFTDETPCESLPEETQTANESWPTRGVLELENVSAAYSHNSANVLSDLTLSIGDGQKVAICGRTGSGKSTLLSTILRLTELTSGTITVNGLDISTLPRQTIRSRMVCLPQEPFLFSDSVRSNADPWGKATDPEIITCLQKVRLWDIICAKGGDLDAKLDLDWLSHGQRQIFCFARAMLCKGAILILDEPTSSLDAETDEMLQVLLRNEFKEHTVLMVAHRLESLVDFDMVVVMDLGRIVETGNPRELLSIQSHFQSLWNSQAFD